MNINSEVQAIVQSASALGVLDQDAKRRVVNYLIDMFKLNVAQAEAAVSAAVAHNNGAEASTEAIVSVEVSEPVLLPETSPVVAVKEAVATEEVVSKPAKPAPAAEPKNIQEFEDISSLFRKVAPRKNPDKILLVAAYLQEKKNQGEITSAAINKELKNVGQGIANVTTSMKQLEKRQPAMIIQTAKEGSTQQARKKFKVTTEGISHVQDMISNPKPRKK